MENYCRLRRKDPRLPHGKNIIFVKNPMRKTVQHRKQYPSYIGLSESGELEERIHRAHALLESCTVCPRECRINRLDDEQGFCRTGLLPVISSFGPHFGEEPPLVGTKGSGTIFVTHCNLSCEYCQNYAISQCGKGETPPAKHWPG
jgi:putative pyruvate formate lyase activating enzyme